MRFGIHFVPTLDPSEKSAAHYFDECLDLCRLADDSGFHSAKITEHYLFPYGGYCPDPVVFLSAVAQHTTRLRCSTTYRMAGWTRASRRAFYRMSLTFFRFR